MNEYFLKDLHCLLVEKLNENSNRLGEFEKGRIFGLYEASCLIQNQLEAFGVKSDIWEGENFDKYLGSQIDK